MTPLGTESSIDYRPVIDSLKRRLKLLEVAVSVMEDLQRTESFREAKESVDPPAAGSKVVYTDGRGNWSKCPTLTCTIAHTVSREPLGSTALHEPRPVSSARSEP